MESCQREDISYSGVAGGLEFQCWPMKDGIFREAKAAISHLSNGCDKNWAKAGCWPMTKERGVTGFPGIACANNKSLGDR